MKFSNKDCINQERLILANRKEYAGANVFSKMFNSILYPRNPKHYFSFYVPQYMYIRAVSFCEDIEVEIEKSFTIGNLAEILYIDFLEYVRKTNDLHNVHNRLQTRDLSPTNIKHYSTDEIHKGVIFEEFRGFEQITARLEHRDALKGEFLLRDMMEIYKDHTFSLENVLEICFCDFIDDYRRSVIKNPIGKITQYL